MSTTQTAPSATLGPAGGRVAARRAVTRWAWRLMRREWRQQGLIVALLALAVAAAAFSLPAAYNLASPPGPQFGSADHLLQLDGSSPKAVAAGIAAARQAFGAIQVISSRLVPIPGSAQTVEFRSENPNGPYTGPTLALSQGRYPHGADQVAITSGIAQTLRLRIGSVMSLGGQHRTVTGLVENPSDLADQFALVAPASAGPPQAVTVLLDARPDRFGQFLASSRNPPAWQARGASTQLKVAAAGLALVTILLLLVALVAAAGFAVIAARRQRQLGMLAAVGATRRQLRMVMVAGGVMVGLAAAVAGTAAGLAAWIFAAPHLQSFAGHRIDRFAIPWSLIAIGMVLAVLTATGAAWWPARAAARLPVTMALSARPPRPRRAHRSAMLGLLLTAAGVTSLALANQSRPPLIILGVLAMALGILFISPLAIRAVAGVGNRAPVTVRLALRDLARHQARSAAALAAVSLALAIAGAVIISSAADKAAASAGNLPDTQMLIWIGQPYGASGPNGPVVPMRTAAQLTALAAAVHQIARPLPHAAVLPLDMPAIPGKPQPDGSGQPGQPVADLGVPQGPGGGTYSSVPLYVATPAVLRFLRLGPETIRPAIDIITTQPGQLALSTSRILASTAHVRRIRATGYASEPASLITPRGLRQQHLSQIPSGWLVTSGQPLTAAQLAAARTVAAKAGLSIESRNTQASLGTISAAATVAGALLALGVLAMAVALIRTEAANDLRTLTAVGATGTGRRTVAATTAGALALLSALIGTGSAYLALAAGHRGDLGVLGRVPVLDLAVIVLGVPAVAALAGWILTRRPSSSLGHRVLE